MTQLTGSDQQKRIFAASRVSFDLTDLITVPNHSILVSHYVGRKLVPFMSIQLSSALIMGDLGLNRLNKKKAPQSLK